VGRAARRARRGGLARAAGGGATWHERAWAAPAARRGDARRRGRARHGVQRLHSDVLAWLSAQEEDGRTDGWCLLFCGSGRDARWAARDLLAPSWPVSCTCSPSQPRQASSAPRACARPKPRCQLRGARVRGMAAPSSVVVHPLVLLSVVDHYNRVAKARGEAARPAPLCALPLTRSCTRAGHAQARGGHPAGRGAQGAAGRDQQLRGCAPRPGDVVRVSPPHATRCRRRAVPFEEDDRDTSIWFLDHSYHEQMYRMCRRINGARLRTRLASCAVLSACRARDVQPKKRWWAGTARAPRSERCACPPTPRRASRGAQS
jgi:hypothetical protein